ncbi:membrane protein insertase YidC [Thermodesulfobacterium sp. TA1]|uniref:membrane protein insertase YidC n=1 Tax=Thermodesulfobacterium sp. TA1 TaxID=2234087 RepID=UPI0012322793|nr:membrane protein insertase YidC [Thermodesulfobacterium sp. TA1]QER41840.1 membrane protein insertase YidC [Thermodesulfobacterium sp. TA1]
MDNRILIALGLSFLVIIFFHYLYLKFVPTPNIEPPVINSTTNQTEPRSEPLTQNTTTPQPKVFETQNLPTYTILSPKYNATLTSSGIRFTEFFLKEYFKDLTKKEPVNLITANSYSLPLEVYLETKPEFAVLGYNGEAPSKVVLEKDGEKELSFFTNHQGINLEKSLRFKPQSYYIDLKVKITNQSNQTLNDKLLLRGAFAPFVDGTKYVFIGPFYYTNHLNEVKVKNSKVEEYVGNLKYLGYEDNYFMVAVIPEGLNNSSLRATFRNLTDTVQEFILWVPVENLKPGENATYQFKVYMGPKKIEEMQKEFPLLTKALYFGIFDFIAKPLLYVLKFTHQFTHNFGWDIILMTLLLRVLFFPLNHISYKSMKKMQELQPVIQRLRDKYKDDPQALNREIMNIYRTQKINPFSGCLPILIQIPVFIAFYKVLLMAIELRHAPFILWITDLSAPERLYIGNFVIPYLGGIPVLTILMGLSMYIQQKLTPSSPDPMQAKLMLFMPIFFTVLFINFPSGLVLYWFVNNVLSIVQQYFTLRLVKK